MKKFNDIACIFLALFLFFIPWNTYLSNAMLGVALAVFAIGRIYFAGQYERPNGDRWKKLFSSVFVIYLFVIVSLLYTYSMPETLKFVEYRVSMLLVPLMFFFGFRLDRRRFELIMAGFVAGVLPKLLYYGITGIYGVWTGLLEWNQLTYSSISSINSTLNDHRTYLAAYALLAMITVACSSRVKYPVWLKVAVSFTAITAIFSFESRAIFGITVAAVMAFPFVLKKGTRLKTAAVAWSVMFLAAAVTFATGSYRHTYGRVAEYPLTELKIEPKEAPGFESRAARWLVSLDAIKKHPFIGYGSGSEREVMMEIYKEKNMPVSLTNGYDLHNQYLSFIVENGIPALLFYLWLLFVLLRRGVREKYLFTCFFLAVCIWMGMFENILNTVHMIVLFAFISSALLFIEKDEESTYNVLTDR